MDNEIKYWKAEYENLRRKKKREIDNLNIKIQNMQLVQATMCDITYELLKTLGMREEEILSYYERKTNETKNI